MNINRIAYRLCQLPERKVSCFFFLSAREICTYILSQLGFVFLVETSDKQFVWILFLFRRIALHQHSISKSIILIYSFNFFDKCSQILLYVEQIEETSYKCKCTVVAAGTLDSTSRIKHSSWSIMRNSIFPFTYFDSRQTLGISILNISFTGA